jgi:hypothetical protein
MDDLISRRQAICALSTITMYKGSIPYNTAVMRIEQLPSAQPQTEWNNHTVACLLAELFGDACACNYNGIDEWLPEKCEVIDACPNPVGVACWEQFLKHRTERRTDDQTDKGASC